MLLKMVQGETPMWLGIGGGYAWFITDSVSIEPGIRYNHSLNEDYADKGEIFQVNVGFAFIFLIFSTNYV